MYIWTGIWVLGTQNDYQNLHLNIFCNQYCSVERTTLQLIHKEIVHKKITELNVLYLDSKLILIWNDQCFGANLKKTFFGKFCCKFLLFLRFLAFSFSAQKMFKKIKILTSVWSQNIQHLVVEKIKFIVIDQK